MNRKLTQSQRLIAALTYLLIVGISFSLLGGNISKILDSSYDQSIWFYSGVLLIIRVCPEFCVNSKMQCK